MFNAKTRSFRCLLACQVQEVCSFDMLWTSQDKCCPVNHIGRDQTALDRVLKVNLVKPVRSYVVGETSSKKTGSRSSNDWV